MKSKFYKIIALFLASLLLVGVVGCSGNNHPLLPDYASAKKYDFFAYSPPNKGVYQFSGTSEEVVLGPDLRTVEGYTVYKEAGFNMVMLSGTAAYFGTEPFLESETCRAWDNALKAGIDKMIVNDKRINALIERKGGLIGENAQIKSEEQLKDVIKGYLSDYIDKEGFFVDDIFYFQVL